MIEVNKIKNFNLRTYIIEHSINSMLNENDYIKYAIDMCMEYNYLESLTDLPVYLKNFDINVQQYQTKEGNYKLSYKTERLDYGISEDKLGSEYSSIAIINRIKKNNKSELTEQERFENEINEAIKITGTDEDTNVIKVCNTPELLVNYGLNQLPIVYGKGHLRDAVKEKENNKHFHGLSINQIYNLPYLINNPVLIICNKNEHDKNMPILILNDCDKDKLPLFLIIKENVKKFYDFKLIDTNAILSLYGRNNFNFYFDKVIEDNGLVFYDKEKVQNIDQLCGTHLFDKCSSFEPNTILQYYNKNVNSIENELSINNNKKNERGL